MGTEARLNHHRLFGLRILCWRSRVMVGCSPEGSSWFFRLNQFGNHITALPAKASGIIHIGVQAAEGLWNEREWAVNDPRFRALQDQPWPGRQSQ